MKTTKPARVIIALSIALSLGFATPAVAEEPGDGWANADAQSLGVETAGPTDIWCLVDGASLGLANPGETCAK